MGHRMTGGGIRHPRVHAHAHVLTPRCEDGGQAAGGRGRQEGEQGANAAVKVGSRRKMFSFTGPPHHPRHGQRSPQCPWGRPVALRSAWEHWGADPEAGSPCSTRLVSWQGNVTEVSPAQRGLCWQLNPKSVHAYTQIYTHTHMHTHIYMYIHMHTYIHTYAHTYSIPSPWFTSSIAPFTGSFPVFNLI